MELSLVSLLGWVSSGGVFWSVCELSMTLGILFANGWGFVPVLLVVWPETFQHWSLQAVCWDWVLVLKWGPLGELTLINIPWGFCYLCPCPHSELQPTPAYPGDTPRPLVGSSPGSYGCTALCYAPVHVRSCVHIPRMESVFPSALWNSCPKSC